MPRFLKELETRWLRVFFIVSVSTLSSLYLKYFALTQAGAQHCLMEELIFHKSELYHNYELWKPHRHNCCSDTRRVLLERGSLALEPQKPAAELSPETTFWKVAPIERQLFTRNNRTPAMKWAEANNCGKLLSYSSQPLNEVTFILWVQKATWKCLFKRISTG